MHNKKFFIYSLAPLLFCLFLLSSCDKNAVFEKNEVILNDEWQYSDSKTFVAEITDTTTNYNLAINLRHAFNFEWKNVWIKIETTFPDGRQFEKRVNLILSESDGEWDGQCLGDNCDIQIPIQQNAFFPEVGKYTFKISQDMRVNPLGFVKSVGMRVEKYNAPK